MIDIATPAQAGKIDRHMIDALEIPGLLLMEQAATAVARRAACLAPEGGRILCVAGSGGNGGDALAAARILLGWGYDARVGAVKITDLPPDAEVNLRFFTHTRRLLHLREDNLGQLFTGEEAVIVDGLLGTGISRPASGLYAQIIQKINHSAAKVVAIDVPSGVFGLTGQAPLAVRAQETVTFQYPKPGHYLLPGRELCGKLHIAPIGVDEGRIPLHLHYVDHYAPAARPLSAHKGNFGRLGILAGSRGMAGAAILAAKGALAAGAGLATLLSCAPVCNAIQCAAPPVMARALWEGDYVGSCDLGEFSGFTALAAGPGLSRRADGELIRSLATLDTPKVLDADALNLLSGGELRFGANTVLTPHPGEFSRLSGLTVEEILEDPIASARSFARSYGVVLLLKGATTVVSDAEQTYLVTAGCPSMAKGGSGDVLTGMIGALLAQGTPPCEAAYGAAFLAGRAGEAAAREMGEFSPTAEDTVRYVGR